MPRITFDKVEKSYGSVQVLPPLDLTLNDGEFTVLVGPSGCGKSTTLRILAGLETLSGGEIYFDDRPIGSLEPKERDIAMVFQDYALYPHMNIARNMSFALRLERRPKAEIDSEVTRVAEMLNIAHLLDRKPAELSGGQRQRVAMGRALVRDAGTFLFDEPLSNLDAKLRARMRTELAEMRDTIDKNMVYVTHDQVEAMTLGDRIVVMNAGEIQQQGTAEELFSDPVNRFVAGFIGSPTMNFLEGEISGDRVKGAGFDLPLVPELGQRAAKASARAVDVGIRPSSIQLTGGAPIDLRVVVSEYLGAQSVLVTRCGETEVLAEIASADRIPTGDVRSFGVVSEDIMLFDRASGARI
ncbi:ABC transporter permease [Jannaschia pagri]|uniref:ABC transporter permease n=1 Tax=Jannaschia pagri TaxID=2829797 RepID=A0ABQ4NIE0_9RHOB|nr:MULTISPECIES: ABC transporter ATP-binding protein [unclassified Jannaschia]GIT89714.1 ABC transporter permease [Jannaschia sp. AI_61]GIT94178.1 ABC transporter permease [Jannaschia sp. AI_62]